MACAGDAGPTGVEARLRGTRPRTFIASSIIVGSANIIVTPVVLKLLDER